MWPLPTARKAIIVGGSLAAAYVQLTLSPATTQFARSLGANGTQIGILGALPTGLLFFQLLAAVLTGHLRHRKWLWFWLSLVQRMIGIPVALGPLLWPQLSDSAWVWMLLITTAINQGLQHFTNPLWMSWMGDYLPHQGLNYFWGRRERSKQWAAAISLLLGAVFFLKSGVDIRIAFSIMALCGSVLGVIDILLFIWIEEPPATPARDARLLPALVAPFKDRSFRTFIAFSSFWNVAALVGSPFISLFLLERVGMDLFQILLLWTLAWIGGAVFSPKLGLLAERHGHRPVLIVCTAFKSSVMVTLLLAPHSPTLAFWILVPVFMLDAFLNAGIAIANNGFLLKNSPAENRTMFIAAGMGYAGLAGGIASIVTGSFLGHELPAGLAVLGSSIIRYETLFGLSLVLRLIAVWLAGFLFEPGAHSTGELIADVLGARSSRLLRLLHIPVAAHVVVTPVIAAPTPVSRAA